MRMSPASAICTHRSCCFNIILSVLVLLSFATLFTAPASAAAANDATTDSPVRKHLRARDYAAANDAADAVLAQPESGENPDAILYLKALAQFYLDDFAEAVNTTSSVIEKYPESDWYRKARFLKAKALVEQKKFKEAETIYADEANRLLSDTRKKEIAGVVIKFADRLATKPDPDELDAEPPNFTKAYNLYNKVLQMEIGRELQDNVMFKKARAIQEAKNPQQAVLDFRAYLEEFDSEWFGPTGSVATVKENPPPPGDHVLEARYFLAQALRDAGQLTQARWEARDLLARLEDDPKQTGDNTLHADTQWLIITAFRMPTPPANELERAVKAANDFLADHRADPRSVKAAYLISQAYEKHGRHDQAIEHYQSFIDGASYELPAGDAATEPISAEEQQSPAELEDKWQKEALYKIGQIRYAQKQYDDAVAAWKRYANRFPNGPHWSASQTGILNAAFQKGVQALAEEEYEDARSIFDDFLNKHPLDQRARQILFVFGQIHYARATRLEDEKAESEEIGEQYQKAIDQWSRLISKYPRTEEASLALFRTGQIYEEKLGKLEKALETYRRLNWGSYAGQAQQRIKKMTDKTLKLVTERKFRTDEDPFVHVKTRNIEKLTVRTYRLNIEAYFRKMHTTGGVDTLDVSLIEPDKTWEITMDDYAKYKPLAQDISIPFTDDNPGAYVVNVSEEDWEATTLVIRSDLDLIFKTSRRQALVFVQNMRTKSPASGVKVLLSDGETVFATGDTKKDGVFTGKFDELKQLKNTGILAVADGHIASHNLNLQGLQFSSGLIPRGFIYTDRSAYRPGEEVSVRGILRDVVDGSYAIPEKTFTITIKDQQGRMIREEKQELSEFGTFTTSFMLPENAALGKYTVHASLEREKEAPLHFAGDFQVRQFKLEKIRLSIDLPRDVYFRGEKVKGTVLAEYYWGEPLVNAPLRYRLPDGRVYTTQTDESGHFEFTFDTSAMTPGRWLQFSATLTADNVTEKVQAFLGTQGFSATVKPSQPLIIAGEPVDVKISTTGADGEPVGRDLNLAVLRRIPRKRDRVLDMIPWLAPPNTPPAEVTIQEHEVSTDPDSGMATVTLELPEGGDYILRGSGPDRFGQTITADSTLKVSGEEDATQLRFFADSAELDVGETAKIRLHSRIESALALLTFEGEEILRYKVIDIQKGYNPVEFDAGHDLFPNFRIGAATMDGRKLRTAVKDFSVRRQLNVTVRPLKEKYLPGEKGEVEITVTDQLGRPVEAELSLALVNEALFAVYPDQTPPILKFFQEGAKRHAEFRVGATCGFKYAGVTRQVIKEILEEKDRLARRAEQERRLKELHATQVARYRDANNQPAPAGAPAELPMTLSEKALEPQVAMDEEAQQMRQNRALGGVWAARSGRAAGTAAGEAMPPPEPRREVAGAVFWLPSVVTNAEGKATVTVPMPETTTEWRLTTRGCTPETLVGEATAQTLTRKDFFVELKTPPMLREGDELKVLARLHNLTKYEETVTVNLEIRAAADEDGLLARRDQKVEVKPEAGGTVVFAGIKVPLVDDLTVQVTARAADREEMNDALTVDVPVHPWGMEYADQDGGVAQADATALLALPDHKYSKRWLSVTVAPALEHAILEMALDARPVPLPGPRIVRYGYNPGSELLAAVSALEYGQRGQDAAAEIRQLIAKARRLTAELVASQRDDGGWSWHGHQGKKTDWPSTCRTYWALVTARDAGIAVNPDTIHKATNFLQNRFRNFGANDYDGKAVVLHALSINKQAEFANLNRLYRARNSLSNTALAYTALGFQNVNRAGVATELAELLDSKLEKIKQPEPSPPVAYVKHGARYPYLQNNLETTALALLLFAQTTPDSENGNAAAQYLMRQRGCFGWRPGKVRGPAIAALAAWFGTGVDSTTDYRVTVVVNGTEAGTVDSTKVRQTKLFEVPQDLLVDGENRVVFKMAGRGQYAYAATIRGFSPEIKNPGTIRYPHVRNRHYYHSQLEYRGRPIGVRSTSPVRHLESGQRTQVYLDLYERSYNGYLTIEEPLPAGAMLVEGSVQGDFSHYEVGSQKITFYYHEGDYVHDIRYELVGYAPGDYRALPTIIRDLARPGRMTLGKTGSLAVLEPGVASQDTYKMNKGELFKLGQLHFNDGLYGEALEYLADLYKQDHDYNERELARMLLWIYTSPEHYEAARVVEMFEILRERYPDLEVPYDKILIVGRAYRDIGEFERAWLVFRATIDGSFVTDSNVSAVLEDEGRFLGSVEYQKKLWQEYPDSANVVASYFAISQALYSKAPNAAKMPEENGTQPDRIDMLKHAADILTQFITLYPNDPLTDDAAFSLANAMLDLKNYPLTVELSERFRERYTNSAMVSSFQYMAALGHFWQHHYREALDAAVAVAEGDSEDRTFAQYIVGQIHHARNNPGEAIQWYEKVKENYPDAAQAIEYFREKEIKMGEVNIFKPGENVSFDLNYRNIKGAYLQIYRVDLMKLYLQQKNLSNITQIQLAGISPEQEVEVELGDGKDYADKEKTIPLELKEEGAYLVICRGDDLFTSGLVLITPLTMEVQENAHSGRVRVNVRDTVDDTYRAEVHVKAIGSANEQFRSGETDLRGIYIADNIRGEATVIARDAEARYAFYRGETWLGAPKEQPQPRQPKSEQQGKPTDYQYNLRQQNRQMQQMNINQFEKMRRVQQKGIKVKAAF